MKPNRFLTLVPVLIAGVLLLTFDSCSKKECKISFTLSGGKIIASGCAQVYYSDSVVDFLGRLKSCSYSGCGETGHISIHSGEIRSRCD